jgi:hypothetical protein
MKRRALREWTWLLRDLNEGGKRAAFKTWRQRTTAGTYPKCHAHMLAEVPKILPR